jgi:Fibronectin type III domain
MKRQFKSSLFIAIIFSLLLIGCTKDDGEITIPSEASNFAAVAGIEEVVLNWTKPADSDTKEYWVTIDPLLLDAFPIDKNLETYTFKNLKGGTKYTFTLLVKNESGGVSNGVSVSATPKALDRTPPSEVTKFTSVSSNSKITLSWTKPPELDFAGYVLTYEPGGGSVILGKEVNSYVIEGLTNGTQYTIVLKTKDDAGNTSVGATVKTIPKVGDNIPPAEASNITFSGDYSKLQFTMTWVNPTDADFQESELTYFYGATAPKTVTIQGPNKSFTIDGSYEQNYTLIIKTKDATGNYSTGVTKKIRFGNFSPVGQTDIDAFDKDIVALLAGKLKLTVAGITNISNFSNLERVEGKFDIVGTGISNLDAFSKLNFIATYINITNNKSLSNFCGFKNLINSGGAPATYTVMGNASNPTKQEILTNCP